MLIGAIIIGQIFWVINLGYPPTDQQINLGINSLAILWLSRFAGLLLMIIAFWMWRTKIVGEKWVLLIIWMSPVTMVLWMGYPLEILKIFLIVLLIEVVKTNKKFLIVFILGLLSIYFINKLTYGQSQFISNLSYKDAINEVNDRFAKEGYLKNTIYFPNSLERLAYNKYYLILRREINLATSFWDVESWFFQEVHPLEQKSIVLFFWPMAFLFLLGLKDAKKLDGSVWVVLLLSWANYCLTDSAVFNKFSMVILWIAPIIILGVKNLIHRRDLLSRVVLAGLTIFVIYGYVSNRVDMTIRPLYWLDNRPWVYKMIFTKTLKDKLITSSIIGKSDKYCKFFRNDCDINVRFENFYLTTEKPEDGYIYAGFVGEYLGRSETNEFPSDWRSMFRNINMKVLDEFSVRDSIANKYGNYVVIAKKND